MIANTTFTPTTRMLLGTDIFDGRPLEALIRGAALSFQGFDLSALSQSHWQTKRYANMLLLGVACQLGRLPFKHGDFLEGAAPFPEGPFILASVLKAPVVLFSAVYRGGRRYTVKFEPFAEAGIESRETRRVTMQLQCARYAEWLAGCCRSAPYNWFNFYDFWADVPVR